MGWIKVNPDGTTPIRSSYGATVRGLIRDATGSWLGFFCNLGDRSVEWWNYIWRMFHALDLTWEPAYKHENVECDYAEWWTWFMIVMMFSHLVLQLSYYWSRRSLIASGRLKWCVSIMKLINIMSNTTVNKSWVYIASFGVLYF